MKEAEEACVCVKYSVLEHRQRSAGISISRDTEQHVRLPVAQLHFFVSGASTSNGRYLVQIINFKRTTIAY